MTETIIVGLIAGLMGVLAAGIPAYLNQRNVPSRKVSDTASIVDSTGKVITIYREEIDRLDMELGEARGRVKALEEEMNKRPTRDELMAKVTELETREDTMEMKIENLRKQIRDLGGTPANGAP